MFTVLALEKEPQKEEAEKKQAEDLEKIKDDDENLKNWINKALEKIGAVCEKKQTKDLEEIKDENENLKIWINKALEK